MPRPSAEHRLLEAGLATVHRQGFGATGVNDIAIAAGVPKGSFYNHFPSKEAFGIAVLDAYWEGAAAARAPLTEPGPVAARVRAHFTLLQQLLSADDFAGGCLLGNLAAEAAPYSEVLRVRVGAVYADWTRLLADCLRERDDGAMPGVLPPEQLATFLVNAFHGAVLRAKVVRDATPFTAFHATLDQLLGD